MHFLHCVLVKLDNCLCMKEDILVQTAREDALAATEYYAGDVFDWRSDNAGRWADDFPNKGVVLGAQDKELFFRLFNEWKNKPYKNAVKKSKILKEEAEITGLTNLPLDESILEVCNQEGMWYLTYLVSSIFELLYGKYRSDSHFYSVPDGSTKLSEETLKDIQDNPELYALVFLDYHN